MISQTAFPSNLVSCFLNCALKGEVCLYLLLRFQLSSALNKISAKGVRTTVDDTQSHKSRG